ncbi:DinB/UmuC family translesion DNA polymerase, partial [Staphylococcus pseudintermedius]
IAQRLEKMNQAGRTVTVKIKTHRFENFSKQQSLITPVQDADEIYRIAYDLYYELKEAEVPIRLVGVTAGGLQDAFFRNMTIYDFL